MSILHATAQFMVASLQVGEDSTPIPPDDLDWNVLVNHADGHTLTPLLANVWRANGVLAGAPEAIRLRLEAAYADNARRQLAVRAELLELDQILTRATVPHLVLKGWPLVERLYADPAERLLRDHDLLVPADNLAMGYGALLSAGFKPLPGDDSAVDKHARPVWRNEGYKWDGYLFDPDYPRPVELHLRLWDANWRGLQVRELPDLWADSQNRTIAGVPMSVLSDEKTLVHLSMHYAGHLIEREARLSQLLDLARFVQRTPSLDWIKVLMFAGPTLYRFLYASLWLAHRIFGSSLPPTAAWLSLSRATPVAFRDWLEADGVQDALTTDFRRRHKGQDYHLAFGNNSSTAAGFDYQGRDYQLTFMAARSLRERIGIVRFAALPPVEQLMSKYNSRSRWAAPFLYPRHFAERLSDYGRALLSH